MSFLSVGFFLFAFEFPILWIYLHIHRQKFAVIKIKWWRRGESNPCPKTLNS